MPGYRADTSQTTITTVDGTTRAYTVGLLDPHREASGEDLGSGGSGLTLDQLLDGIHNFPSLTEPVVSAAASTAQAGAGR